MARRALALKNSHRTLRSGLEKASRACPLDLCQHVVTRSSETFYNVALNSVARMTCLSEGKMASIPGQAEEVEVISFTGLSCAGVEGPSICRIGSLFSQPHMLVCLIFLIFNLCLFLGVKCEILPRLHPLSLHLPHKSQERQRERCLYHTQKITLGCRTRSDPPTTAGRSYTQNGFRGEHLLLSSTILKIASPKAKFKLMVKPHVNN